MSKLNQPAATGGRGLSMADARTKGKSRPSQSVQRARDSFRIEVVSRMYAGVFRGPRLNCRGFSFCAGCDRCEIAVKQKSDTRRFSRIKLEPISMRLRKAPAVAFCGLGVAASSSPLGNPKFVDALAGRKQFAHPTRLPASAGPGLGGFGRILEFRINLGVGTALPRFRRRSSFTA